ncbi:hypothetical protein FRC02_000108 [Tulasnella sp. 418]|nr:hypothetical protein FRC02_000108 [Tulasnella sp. 418]
MESRPMSLSSTAITSTSMGRGESSSSESQASTTDTLLTSIDEYPHDDGNSYTGECFKTFTSKQHQTRLSPPKTYAATNDADATETLYRDDPPSHLEPYRTPSPLRTSPFLVLRSHESPLTNRRQRTSLQPDSPATPIRRRSAKDLIDHFESQSASPSRSAPCSTPTNNSSNTAPSTAPPRFPPSEARLNGPLPAIPLPEPKMAPSPSRSPLRSLINMMKGKKRNKQRSPSPSPVPKRRAMLDDEDGQPPRLLYDTTLNTAPASAQTMSLGNLKPDQDADVVCWS